MCKISFASYLILSMLSLIPLAFGARPELVLQLGHRQGIVALAFSPTGQILASAGEEGLVKIWDTYSGDLKQNLILGSRRIEYLCFLPDGTLLVAGPSQKEQVLIYDPISGLLKRTLSVEGNLFTVSCDEGLLATIVNPPNFDSNLGCVRVIDLKTSQLLCHWKAHNRRPTSLVFSPDGSRLATVAISSFPTPVARSEQVAFVI